MRAVPAPAGARHDHEQRQGHVWDAVGVPRRSGGHRIAPRIRRAIRDAYKAGGVGLRGVAARFGVSVETVRRCLLHSAYQSPTIAKLPHSRDRASRSPLEKVAACSQSFILSSNNIRQVEAMLVKQTLAVFEMKIISWHERAPCLKAGALSRLSATDARKIVAGDNCERRAH
jgi:hypothetical protein